MGFGVDAEQGLGAGRAEAEPGTVPQEELIAVGVVDTPYRHAGEFQRRTRLQARLDVEDVTRLLAYLFADGAPPPPPFPEAGTESELEGPLDCQR